MTHHHYNVSAILSILTAIFGYFIPMIVGVSPEILSWFQLFAFIFSIAASFIVIYKFLKNKDNA
jgi:hypothetical protein